MAATTALPPLPSTEAIVNEQISVCETSTTKSPGPIEALEEDAPITRTPWRLAAILLALYLALFVSALDQTIMATSIPTITARLHSSSGYVWIGGAYLLANAAAGPIWTKASDIWGRKPAILSAVAVFASGSVVAALSVNMRMLIAARALQGTAGGGIMQMVLITISDLFSMRRRVLYIGLTEVIWAVAGGAGPLIGGVFTQLVTWRWCFWINIPVAGLAFTLLFIFLDVHNPKTSLRAGLGAIDWSGTLSILAVTVMLLLGLDLGGVTFPWSSPTIICLIIFGVVMIAFFLFSESKLAKYPLMPLELFKNTSNCANFAIALSQGMCFIAAEYYLPLYFQSVKQASPLRSGVLILPITVAEGLFGILGGIIMHFTGRYREIIWAGVFFMTLGTGLYISFGVDTSIAQLVGFMLIGGAGCGLLFEAPIISVQNTVSQADTATATATIGFTRNLATSMSIVLGGVVFQNAMENQADALRDAGLSASIVESLTMNAAANVQLASTISDMHQRQAIQNAYATSLRDMWIMYTCIASIGIVGGIFNKQRRMSKEHTETKTGIDHMVRRQLSQQELSPQP